VVYLNLVQELLKALEKLLYISASLVCF
jgi:hypothetical protein